MKSRVWFEAGEAPASIGLDMGMLFVWSTPAVLRIDGLSAWGSNCGAADETDWGLSRSMSTARAEKNLAEAAPTDGELLGGIIPCVPGCWPPAACGIIFWLGRG